MSEFISYKEIIPKIDIKKGDILFVSSDIMRLVFTCMVNGEEINLNTFIDTLVDKIGETGTLIFPTYNWAFCKGTPFDYKKTRSKTGSLTTAALKRSDFKRTKHPIYSYAVWGKDQEYLCSLENKDSFGCGSPLEYMYENRAKNLLIDVELNNSFTLVHYVEQKVGVEYRFLKNFTSEYIDESGNSEERTYSIYVKDLSRNVRNTVSLMRSIHVKEGATKIQLINEIEFELLDIHEACDLVEKDIRFNNCRNIVIYDGQK